MCLDCTFGAAAQAQVTAADLAGQYTGDLYIAFTSEPTDPLTNQKVDIAAGSEEGTIDFALYNFGFNGVPLGDIALPNISFTGNNGTVTFGENTPVNLSFLNGAIKATASLNAEKSYIKGDSLVAYIDVMWVQGASNTPIYVTFKGIKPAKEETAAFDGTFDKEWEQSHPWDSSNGYFDWTELEKNDTYWSSVQYQLADYVQPEGWTVAHVTGMNGLGATVVGKKDTVEVGNYAVKLTNTPNAMMSDQIVPGYMSLGTTWATANAMNLSGSADGGAFGGIEFTGRPDAISLRYKRAHGTANATERASVIAYLWKGTYTQKDVPGNTGFGSTQNVEMKDRDRNILGIATTMGGEVTKTDDAACIASVEKYIEGDAEEWTDLTAELNYGDFAGGDVRPEKLNIIISANDYFAARNLMGVGNSLTVDDVKLVYWHALSALAYEGAELQFDENTTSYRIEDLSYDADKLSYTKKGQGATVKTTYNDETNTLTIRVEGEDITTTPESFTEYTIAFDASTGIDSINTAAPATDNAVYTISGVRVSSDLSSLPKGVYVKGGKKIIVK